MADVILGDDMGAGVGMDVFVEASQALIEPLEAFFTNVFVMAVSVYQTVIFSEYVFDLFKNTLLWQSFKTSENCMMKSWCRIETGPILATL